MVTNSFYTRAQYLDHLYQNFVDFGEKDKISQTFFTSYPTKTNNAPKELVLGINVRFPPRSFGADDGRSGGDA